MTRFYLLSVLGCLLTVSISAAADKPAGVSEPPLGSWKQIGTEKVNLIRFEPGRMVQFTSSGLHYVRLRYQNDQLIRISIVGQATPMEHYKLNGDRLILTTAAGKEVSFDRLKAEPPELNPPALTFGKPVALPPTKLEEIRAELLHREKANLQVRFKWRALAKEPAKQAEKLKEMEVIDADDTRYLIALTKESGWTDAARFGVRAVDSVYLIIMHTKDLVLMEAALPEFAKEVKAGNFDAERYAGLYDRFRLVTGQLERYGMHTSMTADGKLFVGPLEDRQNVDQFRAAIGLPTLAQYLARYKSSNGGHDVQIVDN